jgi:hypothetical protein
VGDADHPLALLDRSQPAQERRPDAPLLELAGQGGRGHGVELGLQFRSELDRIGCWHGDIIAHASTVDTTDVPRSGTTAGADEGVVT